MFYEFLSALSIGMTLPALAFCLWVMIRYHNTFKCISKDCIRFRNFHGVSPTDWIGLGIFIGFLGEFTDGLYWFVTWVSVYYGLPFEEFLIKWGVVANLPSREVAVVLAAYGHIRASYMVQPNFDSARLNWTSFAFLAVGIVATLFLLFPFY